MKKLITLLVNLTCLSIVGCQGASSSNHGPVAVVDLDAVAQKLGRDKQIVQLIEQRQMSLNEQVSTTQKSLIQQLNQKKSEFGELSEEEAKQLAEMQTKANAILANTRTQAQVNLTAFQQETIDRFRAEAKPIALEIAGKKGCRVVLSKNDTVVFAFDQTVDLTDELAEVMRSTSPSASTVVPASASASANKATETPVKQAAAPQKASPKS